MSHPKLSDEILKEVEEKLKSYPFRFKGATILSGQEEGAYGWVTVNYLLENFIKVIKRIISVIIIITPTNFKLDCSKPNASSTVNLSTGVVYSDGFPSVESTMHGLLHFGKENKAL